MLTLAEKRTALMMKCAELTRTKLNPANIEIPVIEWDFDSLKGRILGKAHYSKYTGKAKIWINSAELTKSEEAYQDCLNDTVPHELAHIVCMVHPQYGNGHNAGWRRVAHFLGASPNATKKCNDIIYGGGDTYTYTDTIGNTHNVSASLHRKIQSGDIRRIRSTGALLTSLCKYVLANQHTNAAALTKVGSSSIVAPTQGSKATKARAIMRQCVEQGLRYDETIMLMSEGSGYSVQLAKACYKDGQEKHNIGV